MTTLSVTATQGGSTHNGMLLRVFVLTGALPSASQTGNSFNNQLNTTTAFTGSITNSTGSSIYGVSDIKSIPSSPTGSNATIVDNISDVTNSGGYVSFKAVNLTAGTTTRGFTLGANASGPLAMLEILASGTLAEDGSGPASVNTTGGGPLVTASFTPPPGSLLVALVASGGGVGVTTFTVSDGALTWTEKVKNNPSAGHYAGVWIADVPGLAGNAGPQTPPGRQSPVALGLGLTAPSPAPQTPAVASSTGYPLTPPGLASPMALGVPLRSPASAPPGPQAAPVPYVPATQTPLTPPGRLSPVALGLGLYAPSPAPQSPPTGQAAPTPLVPPGMQSPMALLAYLPPGSAKAAPVPPPPPVAAYAPLTPPGRAAPMSIGLPLYAPSPGPQIPPTPAQVVITLALAGMLDRRPGYLKKRALLGM